MIYKIKNYKFICFFIFISSIIGTRLGSLDFQMISVYLMLLTGIEIESKKE